MRNPSENRSDAGLGPSRRPAPALPRSAAAIDPVRRRWQDRRPGPARRTNAPRAERASPAPKERTARTNERDAFKTAAVVTRGAVIGLPICKSY
jgi:hypothetical protein